MPAVHLCVASRELVMQCTPSLVPRVAKGQDLPDSALSSRLACREPINMGETSDHQPQSQVITLEHADPVYLM